MEQLHDNIKIREAVTQEEIAFFWEQLHAYHKRDIFPDPDDRDREYFLDDTQYRSCIEQLHCREHDTCRYILMSRGNEDIGFALAVIYDSEDGKCFLMEFCILPEFRGFGTGTAAPKHFSHGRRSAVQLIRRLTVLPLKDNGFGEGSVSL